MVLMQPKTLERRYYTFPGAPTTNGCDRRRDGRSAPGAPTAVAQESQEAEQRQLREREVPLGEVGLGPAAEEQDRHRDQRRDRPRKRPRRDSWESIVVYVLKYESRLNMFSFTLHSISLSISYISSSQSNSNTATSKYGNYEVRKQGEDMEVVSDSKCCLPAGQVGLQAVKSLKNIFKYVPRRDWKRLKGCVFSPPSLCPVPARGREARKRKLSIASHPISLYRI